MERPNPSTTGLIWAMILLLGVTLSSYAATLVFCGLWLLFVLCFAVSRFISFPMSTWDVKQFLFTVLFSVLWFALGFLIMGIFLNYVMSS